MSATTDRGPIWAASAWTRPAWGELAAEWRAHRLLFGVIAAYALAAILLSNLFGSPKAYAIGRHLALWLPLAFALPLGALALALARGFRDAPRHPLRAAGLVLSAWRPAHLLVGFALALSIGLFYASFVVIKNTLPAIVPFYADPMLARLDAALHGGVDPWRLLVPLFGLKPFPALIELAYGLVWATLLVYAPAVVAAHPAFRPIRRRFFLTFFSAWIGLGNVLAAAFMSGGPVYYGRLTGDEARFAELLRFTADNGLFTGWVQNYLWQNHASGSVELATGISAFPSLHVAMATLYLLAARHVGRWTVLPFGLFLALILAGSVLLGWHYAVDGYASILFVLAVWRWTGRRSAGRAPDRLQPKAAAG